MHQIRSYPFKFGWIIDMIIINGTLDGTIHFWTPCQELVLLYDMIEWLMNILHSMPGVYLNELCTPCQEFIWTLHSMPGNWINVFRKLWKRIIYNIYKKNFNTLEFTLGTEVNSIVQFVRKHHISWKQLQWLVFAG
jgi:hypothetical protein